MSYYKKSHSGCPCQGCENRQPGTGCHDRCEKFLEWHEKKKQIREEERKQNTYTVSDSQRREMWRRKRYSRQGHFNNAHDNN